MLTPPNPGPQGRPPGSPPALDAAAILRRARRLLFRVPSRAISMMAGAYLGARPGTGLTFAELRAYEPGDDVRHLDWNVTARQGRPYVRRFVEERALTLWLIVDVSASLRFGPDGHTKADRASQAAALLATAAVRNGDRVGLTLVSDRVEAELPPATGPRHLAQIVRALVTTPTASRRTALTAGLSRLRRARAVRRALVVVLSDFLTDEPVAGWRQSARRHKVMALRLVDPLEEALPESGLIALEDAEFGTRRIVDAGSRKVRDAYARDALERRSAFRRWCAGAGIVGHEISTADDPIGPLIRIFSRRSARRHVL